MMKHLTNAMLAPFAIVMMASSVFATSFIVPDDEELIQKSTAIVTGVIISASVAESDGYVETIYEIALDRVLKGPFRSRTIVRINSPGGVNENRYTVVESAAHFQIDDEVLLFLTPHRGGWTPTDMTLGKFRFVATGSGYTAAVRDAEDIVGWDRDGKVHKERVRLEAEFVHFIEETVAGRKANRSYEIEAGEVLAAPGPSERPRPAERFRPAVNVLPAPATYSLSLYGCDPVTRYPARWETADMTAGIAFFKNSAQSASGLVDGGVSIIQNGLAAWTNDCESAVNLSYAGTSANLANDVDDVNMIVFNDPGNHIADSWTGSGVIATSFASGVPSHTFASGEWVSLLDTDIVFQNGYAGTEASIEEAMTHEIGHAIGLRHADKHYLKTCEDTDPDAPCEILCGPEIACDPDVEECSSSSIMTASVTSGIDFALQTWDMHGADALYPGTCVVVGPPANVVATATGTSVVNVTWAAAAGAMSYNVYRSANGTTYTLAGSTTAPTVTFNDSGRTASTSYLYKVRAVNGSESGDSNRDLATTVMFTDDPIVAGTTTAKAVHITQLRTAVDAVRALASLGAGSYTDATLTPGATYFKVAHVTDLRSALDAARAALALPAIGYSETITAGVAIKASHINEVRNGVK